MFGATSGQNATTMVPSSVVITATSFVLPLAAAGGLAADGLFVWPAWLQETTAKAAAMQAAHIKMEFLMAEQFCREPLKSHEGNSGPRLKSRHYGFFRIARLMRLPWSAPRARTRANAARAIAPASNAAPIISRFCRLEPGFSAEATAFVTAAVAPGGFERAAMMGGAGVVFSGRGVARFV